MTCLIGLNAKESVFEDKHAERIFRKQRDKLTSVSTIAKVWGIIAEYFSFFNYEIIETIVNSFGTKEDVEKLACYEKKITDYANQRIHPLGSQIFPVPKNEHTKLAVKLDSTYEDCRYHDLKVFENKLKNLLKLEDGALCLLSFEEGCIQLVYVSAASIDEIAFPLTAIQKVELQNLHVIRLQCGKYSYSHQFVSPYNIHFISLSIN